MKNRICARKSLGQINSCKWLDCIMPVEGDKSKYGTFLLYDCKSWQVISPISLTQCRPGISGHTSKNWNKTKKNSWLFKESVRYRQPGLSATVSQSWVKLVQFSIGTKGSKGEAGRGMRGNTATICWIKDKCVLPPQRKLSAALHYLADA